MEEEIGFPLFRRTSRGIELTERGRTFLYEAERVAGDVLSISDTARRFLGAPSDTLTIGIVLTRYDVLGAPHRHHADWRSAPFVAQLDGGREEPAAPDVGDFGRPNIVKRAIAKCEPIMTARTSGFAIEYIEAAFGRLADRRFVAFDPTIEGRLLPDDRAFECRQSKLDVAPSDIG